MQLAVVGVGGAGVRVAAALQRDSTDRHRSYVTGVAALDTDTATLNRLQVIPSDHRHAFGLNETNGTGAAGDGKAGIVAAETDRTEIRRAIDPLITSTVDAVLLVAGLAGGTGSGATPHIAHSLVEIYDRPVYAVGILPANATPTAAQNTLRALRALESIVDGRILFDTHQWHTRDTRLARERPRINAEFATKLGALCTAGEAGSGQSVGQRVVDTSDIIATLSGPETGFIALGYAARDPSSSDRERLRSFITRIRDFITDNKAPDIGELTAINTIETTVREATRGRLTVECERNSTDQGLVVFTGPPDWLHTGAIATQRAWLQDELACQQIRTGDAPQQKRPEIAVILVLSGVDEVPRLTELQSVAGDESVTHG